MQSIIKILKKDQNIGTKQKFVTLTLIPTWGGVDSHLNHLGDGKCAKDLSNPLNSPTDTEWNQKQISHKTIDQ